MSLWGISVFVFFCGLISFLFSQKHYLSMLLSLELVMLSLYLLFCDYISLFIGGGEMILLFLTMMVCEGAFGLCLLIFFSRGFGSDMNYSFINFD